MLFTLIAVVFIVATFAAGYHLGKRTARHQAADFLDCIADLIERGTTQ